MLLTSTTNVAGILPDDFGPLIVEPVQAAALAMQPSVSTVLKTDSHAFHIPVVSIDAASAFVAEGSELIVGDPSISELKIVPSKIGGIVVISAELANDSSPAAAEIVGNSLARSIAANIDAAYFGNMTTPAPAGLGSLTNASVSRIVAGTSPTNLDAFAQALAAVEQDGTSITAFVANPSDALTIQTLKSASGANTPLLGIDATNGTARQVLGIPLLVSPKVAAGTIWGVSAPRNYTIVRNDVQLVADSSVFFTSDRVAVRATMRVGFGYPTPKAVAKIALAAS